jgi:hypothetical protein
MRDQKLKHWLKVDLGSFRPIMLCEIKTQELQDTVRAFNSNFWYACHLSTFPWGMVDLGERFILAHLAACQHKLGDTRLFGYTPFTPDEFNEIRQLTRDILAGKMTVNVGLRSNLILPQDFIDFVSDGTHELYDRLMGSQLILCWTAFETLAGDLWEAAVNAHPQILASLYSKSDAKGPGKSLPMSYLERHKYDIKGRMGTILREHRCNFQKLDGIIEAYRLAFPDTSDLASDTFWNNQDIKSLCAIRNVIVHQAGTIDEDFLKQRGDDPRLAHYKAPDQANEKPDKLALDGELVMNLVVAFRNFAEKMITLVDEWIIANPA